MKRIAISLLLFGGLVAGTAFLAGAPKPQGVSLVVTIEPKLSDGVTDSRIRGDQTPFDNVYTDGTDGVTAQLSSAGTFFMNFWPQTDSGLRDVYFDHSAPAPYASPETAHPELIRSSYPSGYGQNTKIGSALMDSNAVAMQNMTNGSSQCMKLWWASRMTISGQNFGWRDNFHMNDADSSVTPDTKASFVIVRRVDANNWTLESNPSPVLGDLCHNANQSGQASVDMVLHDESISVPGKHGNSTSTVTIRDGYYLMPFRLTLTRR